MVKKICLDTDILIEILHNDGITREDLAGYGEEFYTTSVSIFEVWYGKHEEGLEILLDNLYKISFDEKSAKMAAEMLKKLKQKGLLIEPRDMFIAASCITNDMLLLTRNRKHFERLQEFGLKLV